MQDAGGELCIVFNGEIYNFPDSRGELAAKGHAFRSKSDTEVILAAYREWGTDCLARLNGAFAFALMTAGGNCPWRAIAPGKNVLRAGPRGAALRFRTRA